MNKCNCSIKLENISVYDKNNLILDSISFQVNHGEILALIGRNGSGKTTILKAILSRVEYYGKITFFDSLGKKIANPKIGYVPQKLNFEKSTPLTVVEFFASNICKSPVWLYINRSSMKKIKEILKKFEILHLSDRRLGDLSGGEMQRVLLAFALHPSPDVLILDEPSSALDKNGIEFLFSLIVKMRKEFHMPILLVSHDLEQIYKNGIRCAKLENGKLTCTNEPAFKYL